MIPLQWLQYAPKPRELSKGVEWNIFLSYRSVNRAWVLNLYDVLRELGHKVFIDQCELRPGDELADRLDEALSKSQAGVLIWSEATTDSDWVRREYGVLERQAARKKDFQFVPIKLDSSPMPGFAENRIFLDFSTYPDGPNGGELLRLLHAIVGKPLSPEAAHFANEQDQLAINAVTKIETAIRNKRPERLVELFDDGGLPWKTSAALGCKTAEGLTKLNQDNEAIKILKKIEQDFAKAIRPKQLHALALARRNKNNDLEEAQDILERLYTQGERDPETLGIYGRTWMDRYTQSNDLNDLEQSRDYYAEAFEKAQDDYYTGINAAAKSVLLGTPEDLKKADEYAKKVQQITGVDVSPGDYWKTATVAEVFLIQKKYKQAAEIYKEAIAFARSESGSHQSTWKQACRLMEKLKPNEEERQLIRKSFSHLPDCDSL
jgi:tetratricopeptide (TPR) repeat protein